MAPSMCVFTLESYYPVSQNHTSDLGTALASVYSLGKV